MKMVIIEVSFVRSRKFGCEPTERKPWYVGSSNPPIRQNTSLRPSVNTRLCQLANHHDAANYRSQDVPAHEEENGPNSSKSCLTTEHYSGH